ncbi:MAG: S-methyl-5-thioribose-1-phosphate isomerase [Chloroflexota bacterium]
MSDADRPGARPGDAAPPPDPDEALRLERRRFFRTLADDAVRTAATLVGAVGALRDTTQEMASSVFAESGPAAGRTASAASAAPAAPPGFRSPFRLEADRLVLVDQRRLPDELVEVVCESAGDVAQAIREMVVRGAPALGQVAAAGLALAAGRARHTRPYARRAILRGSSNALVNARPTAVSIRWAMNRMLARYAALGELSDDGPAVAAALREEAEAIIGEATADHAVMARLGVELLPDPGDRPLQLLTHCNTGPLACGQVGTALGVVQALAADGRNFHVYVDETRPWLQGARLTMWELGQAGIPCTLLADAAAGSLLASGAVDAILVGADRIAANGDTANKVGTYPLAVLAARHGVPFHVVAPTATLDGEAADGSRITVEMRSAAEVTSFGGRRIAPVGARAINPSFDITPAELITTIVTEAGVLRAPYGPAIATAIEAREARRPALPPGPDGPPSPEPGVAGADDAAAAPDHAAPDHAAPDHAGADA